MVARRLPGAARSTWPVILDRGLDPASPQVRAELKSALTELRAVTGVKDGAGSQPGIAPLVLSPGPARRHLTVDAAAPVARRVLPSGLAGRAADEASPSPRRIHNSGA